MSIDRYKLLQSGKVNLSTPEIRTYVPSPRPNDYSRGYINRWFLQRLNDPDSPIFEISGDLVNYYSNNPVLNIVKLEWRISGLKKDIQASNRESIFIASEKMASLYKYLPNLIQFSEQT